MYYVDNNNTYLLKRPKYVYSFLDAVIVKRFWNYFLVMMQWHMCFYLDTRYKYKKKITPLTRIYYVDAVQIKF